MSSITVISCIQLSVALSTCKGARIDLGRCVSYNIYKRAQLYFYPTLFFFLFAFFCKTRAVGLKSGPSLAEHVHSDLAPSAKLVSRSSALSFSVDGKCMYPHSVYMVYI